MPGDEQGRDSTDQGWQGRLRHQASEYAIAAARGLALCVLPLASAGLVLALAAPLVFAGLGAGFLLNSPAWMPLVLQAAPFAGLAVSLLLLPSVLLAVRRLANQARRLAGAWCGTPVAEPYRLAAGDGNATRRAQLGWLLSDPASWRDLAWTVVNAGVGWLLAAPAVLAAYGLIGLAAGSVARVALPLPGLRGDTPAAALFPFGIAIAVLGLLTAPTLLRGYGWAARSLLAPTMRAEMDRLAQARAQAVAAAAAERRRIERDLHDGLQPLLVALAVDLGIAEARFGKDPDSVRALLARAHQDAKTAIEELRSLVRGIHPSVLDGRGLDAAVSALIASCPVPVSLAIDLSRRPDPVREAAAYYVAAEAVTNIAKHAAGASGATITVGTGQHDLRVVVEDDGDGGARIEPGGGLAGLAARIASIDGTFTVSSPPGGPTRVEAVIPCEP